MSIFDSIFKKVTGKKEPAPAPQPVTPPPAPVIPPPPVAPVVPAKSINDAQMPANIKATSQVGIELIKGFEGCELKAYPDPATGGDPWTIGYGHTGADTKKGRVITKAEAENILKVDLARFETGVRKLVTVPISQAMFDALISFSFNVGTGDTVKMKGGLAGSTLLKKLNAGDKAGAADEFLKWDKAAGKQMKGLTRRRTAERSVFLYGIDDEEKVKALINEIMMS